MFRIYASSTTLKGSKKKDVSINIINLDHILSCFEPAPTKLNICKIDKALLFTIFANGVSHQGAVSSLAKAHKAVSSAMINGEVEGYRVSPSRSKVQWLQMAATDWTIQE